MKLSDYEVREIRALAYFFWPQKLLAAHYGVSQSTISNIATGKSRSDAPDGPLYINIEPYPDVEDNFCLHSRNLSQPIASYEAFGNFNCIDCYVDTCRLGEYYMVHDLIWATAKLAEGMICVGCLEKRLGRTLTPDDFLECPLTWWPGEPISDTLRNRLGYDDLTDPETGLDYCAPPEIIAQSSHS